MMACSRFAARRWSADAIPSFAAEQTMLSRKYRKKSPTRTSSAALPVMAASVNIYCPPPARSVSGVIAASPPRSNEWRRPQKRAPVEASFASTRPKGKPLRSVRPPPGEQPQRRGCQNDHAPGDRHARFEHVGDLPGRPAALEHLLGPGVVRDVGD